MRDYWSHRIGDKKCLKNFCNSESVGTDIIDNMNKS